MLFCVPLTRASISDKESAVFSLYSELALVSGANLLRHLHSDCAILNGSKFSLGYCRYSLSILVSGVRKPLLD